MLPLSWVAWKYDKADGYGRQALYMVQALAQHGYPITPVLEAQLEWPVWAQHLAGIDWAGITIANQPGGVITAKPGRQWAFSMWEDTRIPEVWAEKINDTCERLIVPCAHNARVFALGGVSVPIHVVPLGIDPQEHKPLPRWKKSETYTFLAIGDRARRKGWDIAIVAFCAAFPASKYPNVRLVIKTREDEKLVPFGDTRIMHWREDCSTTAEIFAQGDCFVFPSKGEGWGLPPREAVALGVPTIVPRHTGLEDGIDHWGTVILEKGQLCPSDLGHGGHWYEPDYEELAAAMKWCYEHPDEAREKALDGSEWLRAHQTWNQAADKLSALLEKHS